MSGGGATWRAARLAARGLVVLALLPLLVMAADRVEPAARAVALLQALVAGDLRAYGEAAAPPMREALPASRVGEVFADLARQGGAFVGLGAPQVQSRGGMALVEVPLEYARAVQVARVAFDAEGRLVGLQIRPRSNLAEFRSAPYVDPARFTEQEVVVDAGGWPLPGTLSVPKGAGPFPALVLVHGSGPNDRDSSIGPNRMFRDLAEGLASRGVVVLRYEKRSREHAARLGEVRDLTPRQEVIDDVLAALRLLRGLPSVRAGATFVAGHSFGGMLAPAIAAEDGGLAGVIVLAGAIRPLEDTIVSQLRHLAGFDGVVSAEEAQQISGAEAFARQVKALKRPGDRPPQGGPASAPTSYWLALRDLYPARTAATLRVPVLVLQGERDYQVTMADFAAWRVALAGHPQATFQSFPRLNHAFMPGEGPSSPAEYSIANHVDGEVIETIAAWIDGQARVGEGAVAVSRR